MSTLVRHPPRLVLALGAALCWSSAAARTPSPAAAEPNHQGELIVWSTARSSATAQEQLHALRELLRPLARFAEMRPTVVAPGAMGGLPPGAFVVTLGLCSSEAVGEPLRLFQSLAPDVTVRTVRYSPSDATPACPTALTDFDEGGAEQPWRLSASARTDIGRLSFLALAFSHLRTPDGDFTAQRDGLRVVFMLMDTKRRTHVYSAEYRPPTESAELKSLAVNSRGISALVHYTDPPCYAKSDRFVAWQSEITASTSNDTIQLEDGSMRRLREGICNAGEGKPSPAPDAPSAPEDLPETPPQSNAPATAPIVSPDLPL